MTTKLAGESTFFLPFNKGTSEGGPVMTSQKSVMVLIPVERDPATG
jgi:hypothetical protein